MEKLKGFETAKVMTGESTQLPKGGYIVKIMDCKEETTDSGYKYLDFAFDVAEGDFKGHFADIYTASTDENKKWKGTYRTFIPDENSQYYEDNLTRFKTMISNFEESNKGFHWDWDETKLKGKIIGIVYGEEEYQPEGKDVLTITKARYFTSVQRIRDGKFKIPQLKKLAGKSSAVSDPFAGFAVAEADDKLPWEN